MDEMSAFERQVARALHQMAGPGRHIDAMATAHTAASRSSRWRLPSMLLATRLVVAGAIVALFAGFLAVGVPPVSPGRQAAPGATTTAGPSAGASGSPAVTPNASPAVLETAQPGYEATARLTVDPGPEPSVQDLVLATAALERYAAMAETPGVAGAVIDELGLDESVESLLGRVSATADSESLELTLRVSDDDPEVARALAQSFGDQMSMRIDRTLITSSAGAADDAIAQNRRSINALTARLNQLNRKANKTEQDRSEIIALAGQISALQRDNQVLLPNTRAYVRTRLVWLEEPAAGQRLEPRSGQEAQGPTRDVVLAAGPITRGTTIGRDMLIRVTVPAEWADGMALLDAAAALGQVAAIDIAAGQLITPDMLITE